MHPVLPGAPRVSVGIPLYRSARFTGIIAANIEALAGADVEILISDRHRDDDALDTLRRRFAHDRRVRFFESTDRRDWVYNTNFLMQQARGELWRFLPHDDTSPSGSLEALVAALDSDPEAVLAFGPTHALDLADQPLPERDQRTPMPSKALAAWDLELALEMNWLGYFDGAFKGLVRRRVLHAENLYVRSTHQQVLPERCWLFALCLLGRFAFVPDAPYFKRFHEQSTHRQWVISGRTRYSMARCMTGYLLDLVDSPAARAYGAWDLWLNARRSARWQDAGPHRGPQPPYRPAPDPLVLLHEKGLLPDRVVHGWAPRRSRAVQDIRQWPLPDRGRNRSRAA